VLKLLTLALLTALPLAAQEPDAKDPNGRVVLVLPFDNRSGQPSLAWIGDSFPDTLNARLSSSGFLPITRDDRQFALDHLGLPPNFRPTRATTLRIAQTLDADYVIVGSFNLTAIAGVQTITVQAQVLDVKKLFLSAPLQDSSALPRLFDAENGLAWKVARQIDPQFKVAEQTFLAASAGVQLSAFENYIRGTDAPTAAERQKRLEVAVADSPGYAAAQLALGKELYAQRQYDQAAAVLAKVAPSNRLALEANFYLGLARFNAAKYAEAEQAFAFVAARLPLPEVVNDQAVAQSRQGKDATPLFRRASLADPNDPDYHYNLAVSLLRKVDFHAAQTEVDAALKLKPNDGEATQLKALIVTGQSTSTSGFEPTTRLRRTYSEASFRQAAYQVDQLRALRVATLPPDKQAAEYAQAGRDYLAQGLLPEAEQEFQAAIAADSGAPAGHAGLAAVREQSGDIAQARNEAGASLRLHPSVEAYLILARLDLQANNLQASAQDVSAALHLEPNNPAANGMKQALRSRGQNLPN
jgi:tetratricopeptide (TPR) repeat protein